MPLDLLKRGESGTALTATQHDANLSAIENEVNGLIPAQSGQSGKFLTTDGSVPSWGTPAGGSSLSVRDEGSTLGNATIMNFVGAGVTATYSSGTATVTIPGGGTAASEVITPEAHGAAGNGVTNDYTALNSAIAAAASSNKPLWFKPEATYLISPKDLDIPAQWTNFTWYGNRATIKVANAAATSGGYGPVWFDRCKNFTIYDLTVDGNYPNRTLGENWGANSFGLLGCEDFALVRCWALQSTCDGFHVLAYTEGDAGTNPKRGWFVDCWADDNARNGMSIIEGTDIYVSGGRYSGSKQLLPCSGIDVEPNVGSSATACSGIHFNGVLFSNNYHDGLRIGFTKISDVTVLGCMFYGNGGRNSVSQGTSQMHAQAITVDCADMIIAFNNIWGHTQANANTFGAIFCPNNAPVKNILITGNKLRGNLTSSPAGTNWGHIHCRGAGADKGFVISNNLVDITGSSNPGIVNESTHAIVGGNRIIGTSSTPNTVLTSSGDYGLVTGNLVKSGTGSSQISVTGTGSVSANNIARPG